MNQQDWHKTVLNPKNKKETAQSWGKVPNTTWNAFSKEIEHVFCPQAVFLFVESVYLAIYNEEKYPKPPKGVLPKHLCFFLLHWLITALSFDKYVGDLSLQISKSYLSDCLKYILKWSKNFVAQ